MDVPVADGQSQAELFPFPPPACLCPPASKSLRDFHRPRGGSWVVTYGPHAENYARFFRNMTRMPNRVSARKGQGKRRGEEKAVGALPGDLWRNEADERASRTLMWVASTRRAGGPTGKGGGSRLDRGNCDRS